MKCATYIHVYCYDIVEELHNMFPKVSKDEMGQVILDALFIPDGGDAASYYLGNPNLKGFAPLPHEEYLAPLFEKHFPEQTGIYIDLD